MLILFMFIISLVILFMSIYITKRFKNLFFVKKIKNKKIYNIVSLSPILFLIIFSIYDFINTVIVYLHIFLILIILDLIMCIIRKIFNLSYSYSINLLISIFITGIYLGFGYYYAHHIYQTNYVVSTNKNIDNFKVVQITDSHIGATFNGDTFIKYMNDINKSNPDIVVVTGDFVDDSTTYNDMIKGCMGLGNLKTKYGVYYIYGNHDKGYFNTRSYSYSDLKKELIKNNVIILEDEVYEKIDNIVIIGRKDSQTKDRLSIKKLMENIDKDKYVIVLDHEPNDYENEKIENIDLVLSGHTHGGQLFPLKYTKLMTGPNNMIYGKKKIDNTTFIVSSGISDWAIKFKTDTISEYVVIDIKSDN